MRRTHEFGWVWKSAPAKNHPVSRNQLGLRTCPTCQENPIQINKKWIIALGKPNKLTFSLVFLYHVWSCWIIIHSWCTPGSVDSTIFWLEIQRLWFFNLHFSWNHNSAHPCFLLLKSRCFFFDPFACWFNPSFYSTKAHVHHLNYHFLDMFFSYITFLLVESPCLLQRCQSAPTRQSSHRGSGRGHRKTCLESKRDNRGVIHQVSWNFPLVIYQFAMENGHLVRWFTYQKWWFSI